MCSTIKTGYLEISANDPSTEDRYCGTFLAGSSTDAADSGNSVKQAGLVYGKCIEQFPVSELFL